MKAILTWSLAPARLPEKRAAAPAAFRKSRRPVDACAMPLVVSGFPGSKMRCAGGRAGVNRSPKDPTRRIMRCGNDLLPGECGEIVPKLRPQEHVWDEAELHTSAHAEDDFPHIVRREAGDLRNRLWERLRTGDDVFLRAGASGEKRPPTMSALFEMEQQLRRQGIGLALNVGFHTGRLKERVAVVIKVTKLGGDVI